MQSGFSFTGLHLGYSSLVKNDTTHELNLKMSLSDNPVGGFSHHCEGFGKNIIEGLTICKSFFELVCLGSELGIGRALISGSIASMDSTMGIMRLSSLSE